MTEEEIFKFQKRARLVATRKGYSGIADDFAQEVILTFLQNPDRHSTIDQLFIDYLRQTHGDTRTSGGAAKSKALLTVCSLDDARNIAAEPRGELKDRGCAFLFGGKQADLYELYFINELSEASIGSFFGVTESRICQMLKPIKKSIQDYYLLQEYIFKSETGEGLDLVIDWIKL